MLRTMVHGLLATSMGLAALATIFPTHNPTPASAAGAPELPTIGVFSGGWDNLANTPAPQIVSVKLRETSGFSQLSSVTSSFGGTLLKSNSDIGVHTMAPPPGTDPETFAAELSQDARVEWAEPVRLRQLFARPMAPLTPNDTFYPNNQKWYYDTINAPEMWNTLSGLTAPPAPTIVAVLDSGLLCTHPDIADNVWVNPREIPGNGVDDDGNGFVDDVNGYDFVGSETGNQAAADQAGDSDPCLKVGDSSLGNGQNDDGSGPADAGVTHGTFVAGVIGAIGNNGQGVAGVCWTCKIMPVRIANPEGSLRTNDTSDAIVYAARNGAKVINISAGGPQVSQAEIAAINLAVSLGATVVAAAGNDNMTPMAYPARLSNVIAVGASGHSNTKGRAPFSNWGTGTSINRTVDLVAPGVDIASTAVRSVADQTAGLGQAGAPGYLAGSGTSFSTPLVSGVVGLMFQRNPNLTPSQAKVMLQSTSVVLPDDPTDIPNAGAAWAGAGMVNTLGAVAAAAGSAPPLPTIVPTTPSATPTASPSVTPIPGGLPAGALPQLQVPATGATLADLGTTLQWKVATGTTQYQLQVTPANDDGPAINLIRDVDTSYIIEAPVFGVGPYVMLPGMTYSWRVRTTTAAGSIDENSPQWGSWSPTFTFRTRTASSATISAASPSNGGTASSLTPNIRWGNTDNGVFYYEFMLSKDQTFNTNPATATSMVYSLLIHGGVTNPPDSYTVPATFPLEPRTQYYWRVRPRIQGDGAPVAWSSTFRFTTP